MGLPVNLKDSTGASIDPVASVPMHSASPDGNPVDSALIASSAVAAVGDILLDVSTRGAAALLVDFTGGSGWGLQAESTIDGATWRACPMQIISRQIDTLVYSGVTINGNRWAALPCGGLRTRLRVTTLGSGSLTAVARTSAVPLTENHLRPRGRPHRIASGVSGTVRTVACMLLGACLDNTSAGKRYLQLYNKNSSPTIGTDTPAVSYPIPAGASIVVAAPEIAFSSGMAWAVTTDFGGATAATAGDVVGTLLYTL